MDFVKEYRKLMADFEMKPLTYNEVAEDWEANPTSGIMV